MTGLLVGAIIASALVLAADAVLALCSLDEETRHLITLVELAEALHQYRALCEDGGTP